MVKVSSLPHARRLFVYELLRTIEEEWCTGDAENGKSKQNKRKLYAKLGGSRLWLYNRRKTFVMIADVRVAAGRAGDRIDTVLIGLELKSINQYLN